VRIQDFPKKLVAVFGHDKIGQQTIRIKKKEYQKAKNYFVSLRHCPSTSKVFTCEQVFGLHYNGPAKKLEDWNNGILECWVESELFRWIPTTPLGGEIKAGSSGTGFFTCARHV
jgi:hypothetical protein